MPYKTIYTIEITGWFSEGIWYAQKRGFRYEAEKTKRPFNMESKKLFDVYMVNRYLVVYPEDCIVISTKEIECERWR